MQSQNSIIPVLAFERYKACLMLIDQLNDHEKLKGFKKPNEYVNLNV